MSVQTGERHVVARDSEGKPLYRHKAVLRKPGEEVELPEAEIVTLRAAGFLVDPDAPAVKRDIGPTFTRTA